MANTSVEVEILMTRKEFFCDINFTVLEASIRIPIPNAKGELYTTYPGGELIMTAPTDAFGKVTMSDMPPDKTYTYRFTHPDYNDKIGQVITV